MSKVHNTQFSKYFLQSLLKEEDNTHDSTKDQESWEKSLDPETDPETFKGEENPLISLSKQNVDKVQGWIKRIEEIKDFVNGLDPSSIQSQINQLDHEGSTFQGVVRAQTKKLTRIAEDLSAVAEIFKTYVLGADRKHNQLAKMLPPQEVAQANTQTQQADQVPQQPEGQPQDQGNQPPASA